MARPVKYVFVPDTSGVYTLIATVVDDCEVSLADTINITVNIKDLPYVDLGDSLSFSLCQPEELCFDILTNISGNPLSSNFGTIDPETGQLCFTPDTSGIYTLTVEGTDSCGFYASASKVITIDYKSTPTITNFNDSLIYLCTPTNVCLPVTISDIDNDIASITVSRGTYSDGEICFVPYDKGSYSIVLTVTDSCGNVAVDTANIEVTTDQNVSIIVPNDTSFFTCQLDTFCFPVSGIPEGSDVSVSGINTWYDAENSQICYYAECSNNNKITLTVTTPCNTFTNSFNVEVVCNTDPLVILPQDTTIFQCILVPITIPIGVSDVDNNLTNVTVVGGVYDDILNTVTFTPDTAGTYYLTALAVDSCGAEDFDEIYIIVEDNEVPVCSVPSDTLIELCDPGQIQLPVSAFDEDNNLVSCEIISGVGQIIDGYWTYNAVADDSVTVTIRCIDECGSYCESSFTVLIKMNNAPSWSGESEFNFDLCELTEVSIPLEAFDIDGDFISFEMVSGSGLLIDSNWVYTPNGSENYSFYRKSSR